MKPKGYEKNNIIGNLSKAKKNGVQNINALGKQTNTSLSQKCDRNYFREVFL